MNPLQKFKQLQQQRQAKAAATPAERKVNPSHIPASCLFRRRNLGPGECWKQLTPGVTYDMPAKGVAPIGKVCIEMLAQRPEGKVFCFENFPFKAFSLSIYTDGLNETIHIGRARDWTPDEILINFMHYMQKGSFVKSITRETCAVVSNEYVNAFWHECKECVHTVGRAVVQVRKPGYEHLFTQPGPNIGISITEQLTIQMGKMLEVDIDITDSAAYRAAVDSHDKRVVNNMARRIEMKQVLSTQPQEDLMRTIDSKQSDVWVLSSHSVHDRNLSFLYNVALATIWNNVDRESVTLDELFTTVANRQPWAERQDGPDYYVSAQPEWDRVVDSNFSFIVGPTVTPHPSGQIGNNIGKFVRTGNSIAWSFNQESETHVTGWETGLLCGDATCERDGKRVAVVSRRELYGLQILMVTSLPYAQQTVVSSETHVFDVPLLSLNFTTPVPYPTLTIKPYPLNRNLLERLLARDLSGDVTEASLTQYAVALSWFGTDKHDNYHVAKDVAPDEIRAHVYVAKLITQRRTLARSMQALTGTGLNPFVISLLAAIEKRLSPLKEGALDADALRAVMELVNQPAVRTAFDQAATTWATLEAWIEHRDIAQIVGHITGTCTHHLMCANDNTGHACACCGAETADRPGGLCPCCVIAGPQCQHETSERETGDTVCSCCHGQAKTDPCNACELVVIGPPTDTVVTQEVDKAVPTAPTETATTRHESTGTQPPAPATNLKTFDVPYHKSEMAKTMGTYAAAKYAGVAIPSPEPSYRLTRVLGVPSSYTTDVQVAADVQFDPPSETCGWDVIQFYCATSKDEKEMAKVTRQPGQASENDIVKAITQNGINTAIVVGTRVQFTRANDTEEFAVVFLKKTAGFDNHWVAARYRETLDFEYYSPLHSDNAHHNAHVNLFSAAWTAGNVHTHAAAAHNLAVLHVVHHDSDVTMPVLDGDVFSNGPEHELTSSRVHIKVPAELLSVYQGLSSALHGGDVTSTLRDPINIGPDETSDVKANVRAELWNAAHMLASLSIRPEAYCRVTPCSVVAAGNKYIVSVTNTKLKRGDWAFTRTSGITRHHVITSSDGHVASFAMKSSVRLMLANVMVPTSSTRSAFNTLDMYTRIWNDLRSVETTQTRTVITGPPGSGKTTMLREIMPREHQGKRVLAFAATSGAVQSLRGALNDMHVTVMSREAAVTAFTPGDYDVIVIDEASLCPAWTVRMYQCSGAKHIYLLGDHGQIAFSDRTLIAGERYYQNGLDYAREMKFQHTNLEGTRRYGEPLAGALRKHPAMANVPTLASHGTTLEIVDMPMLEINKIKDRLYSDTVILTFYNAHVQMLTKHFPSQKIGTPESFQGSGFKRVMVVQMALHNSGATNHVDPAFTITAATRTTHELTWVSVGFGHFTDLASRMGTKIGIADASVMLLDLKKFNVNKFKQVVAAHTTAAKVKRISHDENKIDITFAAMGMKADVVVTPEGITSTAVPQMYFSIIRSAIEASLVSMRAPETVVLSERATHRVRLIAFIAKVYDANNLPFTLKGDLAGFTVTVGEKSCGACCSVKFKQPNTDASVFIPKSRTITARRTVSGYGAEIIAAVLNMPGPWNLLDPLFDNEDFSLSILAERIQTWAADTIALPSTNAPYMWVREFDNALICRDANEALGVAPKANPYDCYNWYPFYDRANNRAWSLRNGKRVIVENVVENEFQSEVYSAMLELTSTLRRGSVAKTIGKFWSANIGHSGTVPGMLETWDYHKTHNTETYRALTNMVGKIRISAVKHERPPVYVNATGHRALRQLGVDMRRVMNNGTDVFSDGPLAAVMTYVTSILMDEYGTCHIEPDSAITVADSASLGPFSYTVPSWCEQSRLTWATSSTIARKMLERFRSRVPASDVRHGRLADLERSLAFREGTYGTVSGDVQRVVTPHVLSLAPNDLSRHYSNYAGKTYSFVTRDIVRTAHGSGFVLPHSDRLFLINKHQLASIEDGRMIAGTDLRWHTIDNFEGLRLLRLSKQRLWARNTTQHLADATVKMPTINITLPELARTGELFTHSTLRINKNFMTNLRKRLLLKPTDREDLYAYARTMMQTAVYMTTGAASKRVCTARDVEGMVHLALIMNSYEQVAFSGTKIGSYADAELKDNMIALLARLCDDGKRNVDAVVAQLSSMVPHVSDLARSYRDIAAVFNDIMRHLSSVDGDFMAGDEMITPRGSATMRPRIKHLQRVNLNDKHGAIAGKDEFAGTRPSDNFYSDLIEDPAAVNVERFARLGRGDAHCEPRWTHALMGSGKFAVGRDWLAFKNTHWVSSKYLNQPALSTTQQRFLSTLSNAVDKLEHADSYHLYSLCDGIASRSPATAGPGRNLHVNIGASGSYDPLGFVSILRSDPGRFGACARVIVAHMLVTRRQGCTVYIRSGRPGPHVYWAEAALAETDDERLSMGNTVALPFTTFGPFLDGMRIVSPLQNMDGFVKNNMNYYWLYGIDEADHTVFNIKTTLTWERATFPYSNWFFHDDRENVMHGIDAVTVATRAPGALTDELVIEGTRNPENMGSLIKLHDRAHSGPTRSGDSPSALASAWAAGGKAPRGDVNKKWLPYRTTNRGTGCIEVYRGTASPGTVVYDPHTDGQCVWHCFAHYARHAADWDDARIVQAYQSLAPKTFETVQDIAKYGVAMGFSTSVTTPDGEYYSVQIDGSPSLCLHVKYTMGTYFHCTIVEQHTITEQRRQREDTIDVAGLSAAAGNARLAQRLIRDGLSGRAGGDVANAIEATRGPIWPRAVVIAQNPDLRTKGRDGTDEFMQVSGAQPASVIAIPGSEGLDFKVAFEHAGRVWIEHPYTDVYIALSLRCSVDSLVARNARDDKPALVDVSGTTDTQPSFINHTSKTNAAPELQHHVVDSAGRPLIVVDFDNTNHHGSAAHDDLAARGFDALILPGEHMDEQTCDELATQGMLIAGVTGGKLRYRTCTINDDLAAAVYYDSGVHHEQRPTKAALEAYNQGWAQTRVGNRYGLGPACNDDACPCNQVADSLNATGRARLELGRAESRALLACTGETSFDLTHRTDTHTRLQWVFQLNTGDSECEIYEYAADKWMSTFDVFAVGSGHMLVSEFAAHVNSKAYYDYKTGRTTKTERAPEPRPNMNDRVDAVKHALGDSGSAHTISAEAPTRREYEYIEHMDASVELLTDEYHERIAAKTMDYWDNNTALLPTVAPTPHDAVKFNVKEHDIELKTVGKAILTPYPSHAQPNYTKRYHAMQQAAVDLFGKSFKLRQVEHDPEADARELVRTYFTRSVPSTEIITFDARATAEWIAERPGADNIRRELDELLDEGWATHPINRVNVHIKLESRLKDKPHNAADIGMPATISEQRVRLIVWQPKAMTALFAPIFHEAKKRLKACLRRDVIYTDGMSPPELSAVLSTYDGSGALFVEDDLEKQDRQTDMTLIKTEMLIYKWLGVDPRVVDMWQRVHEHWSAKGYSISFDGHASRQTGQATTSIGNTIVNMLVHMRFVKTLGQNLVIMMCLGDDNLMVCRGHVTENMVSQNSARHFNMKSKPSVSKTHGGFLRMIVTTRSNGTLMCGPDFIRLRRKYEVTNGVSEATVENLQARAASYCAMVGPVGQFPSLFPPGEYVSPPLWYEPHKIIAMTAEKYDTTHAAVEGEIARLFNYVRDPVVREVTTEMFVARV